jgi:hypothetical protein
MSDNKKEVSETAFEYLIGEMINLEFLIKSNDKDAATVHRLEMIGHNVGYRCSPFIGYISV